MISNGNKFHGLVHQAWMKENAQEKAQRQRLQQQQEVVERAPWDYDEQNRANAELILGLAAGRPPGVITQPELTGNIWDMCTDNNESAEWANFLAQDLAEVAPFDLDGCCNEWRIFDIRRHGGGPRTGINEDARGRLQLDSGYYL